MPTPDDAPTQDPLPTSSTLEPCVVVLYHQDFNRLGAVAFLTPGPGQPAGRELVLGRYEPKFRNPDGAEHALDDPCLSRDQLRLAWSDRLERFLVRNIGKRRIGRLAPDGRTRLGPLDPEDDPFADLQSGGSLEVQDRLMLQCTWRSRELNPNPVTLTRQERVALAIRRHLQERCHKSATDPAAAFFRPVTRDVPPFPLIRYRQLLNLEWRGSLEQALIPLLDELLGGPAAGVDGLAASAVGAAATPQTTPPPALAQPTKEQLATVLVRHEFVLTQVAKECGIGVKPLRRMMRDHGLPLPEDYTDDQLRQALRDAGDLAGAVRRLRISAKALKDRLPPRD